MWKMPIFGAKLIVKSGVGGGGGTQSIMGLDGARGTIKIHRTYREKTQETYRAFEDYFPNNGKVFISQNDQMTDHRPRPLRKLLYLCF